MEPDLIVYIFLAGIAATLAMDAWQGLLSLLAKIPRPEWSALGRWLLGMPKFGLVQLSLADLPKRNNEALVGWVLHYLMGIAYAAIYVDLLRVMHLPGLAFALCFAAGSLLIPWCIVMPCTGYGFFASKTPKPMAVRIYNAMTHFVFFLSLYAATSILLPRLFEN